MQRSDFDSPVVLEIEPLDSASAIDRCHQSLSALYAYWDAKRGDRRMPSRVDIDPVDLKAFWRLLCLIDVVPDERCYVHRVVGTQDVQMRGYDPTGKSVKEGYYGESAEDTTRYLDHVVRTRNPVLYRGTYRPSTNRVEHDEVLFLPLSENGVDVNKILVLSHTVWLEHRDRLADFLNKIGTRR